MIPYGKQEITQDDIDAVLEVLCSDYLTQGPKVPLFEQTVANYCGVKYRVATNSATSALHLACLALTLGPGDWLWTSPISFVASANCGLYCGAKIDFIDIDSRTYNLCPSLLEQKLINAEKIGKLPKVLVPVHLCGQSCDMEKIHTLSTKYGFKIVEDASHAIGGKYKNEPIGNCRYSDITVFSFHPVKIITTGEGGMAMTNSQNIAETLQLLRSHGITRDEKLMTGESDGDWYYQQVALGFNYRITELQAALGVSQIQRLDDFVAKRHVLQERYDTLLDGLSLTRPHQDSNSYSSLHLYPIKIILKYINKSRKEVFDYLRSCGVGVNLHYIPIHTHPFYQRFGFIRGDFPNAENYYRCAISIPIFHGMTVDQQDVVALALRNVLR